MVEPRNAGGRRVASSRLHRTGADAQRVLLVGDGVHLLAADAGAPLADLVADRLAARTGRGLDLDVVWDLAPALQAVGGATEAWRLWRYEAVVVVVQEARLHDAGWWAGRVPRLAQRVIAELAEASGVLVVHLRRDGDPTPADPGGRSPVTSLAAPLREDGRVDLPAARAEEIADRVAALLDAAGDRAAAGGGRTAGERRAAPQAEAERQRAVERTRERLGGVTPDLERVVLLARNTFEVPFVQVNLLDGGRIRTLAFVGAPGDGAEQPLCTVAIGTDGPTIIGDTWRDRRLDANPHVHAAEHPVRFYAAHPIESVDGYRIGTLCVFDLVPHDVADADAAVLRDLALLAEAEISALPAD